MKFTAREVEEEPTVTLTLEKVEDEIMLKANGHSLMGFKNGKFRKY